ncbi:MAG: hypothetical protein RL376_118 [Verrucomicrobiota bacterium]|jgi:hypothetical protein
MHPKPSREEVEKLVEKLAKEPALFARMAALVNEVEAEKGGTLEEAEERMVKCVREAGREALNSWMEASAQGMPQPVNARRGAKKKSAA